MRANQIIEHLALAVFTVAYFLPAATVHGPRAGWDRLCAHWFVDLPLETRT